MSIYKIIGEIGPKYFRKDTLFKWGFNFSPMYRTSTARLIEVSEDLLTVRTRLPISFRNKNYVGSIFGGCMFAAVDPIPMVQLINILNNEYVVWDKSAEIFFKAPARENLYADFTFRPDEIDLIKEKVAANGETEIVKNTCLTDETGGKLYCEVSKTIYIASKEHYRKKSKAKAQSTKI